MKLTNYYLSIIIIYFLTTACSSWKTQLVLKGGLNQAVENSVSDFLYSSSLHKKDSVFSIYIEDGKDHTDFDINDNVFAISISASNNKLLPTEDNKIGTNHPYFPTKYIEKNNKLFYWYNSNSMIELDIINILSKYNQLDSLNVNGFVGIPETSTTIDETKKAIHYYVCKNNLKKYTKVTTSTGLGYYKSPKLKCIK